MPKIFTVRKELQLLKKIKKFLMRYGYTIHKGKDNPTMFTVLLQSRVRCPFYLLIDPRGLIIVFHDVQFHSYKIEEELGTIYFSKLGLPFFKKEFHRASKVRYYQEIDRVGMKNLARKVVFALLAVDKYYEILRNTMHFKQY